jgi:hypothetical protein
MPTRTPSNGLETANQNETFQPGPWTLGFVFILFFSSVRRSTSQEIWDFPPNTVSAGQSSSDLQFSILRVRRLGYPNDAAGSSFELLAPVSLIAGASRFVRQDIYRSRLPRSIGNGNQCASLVSLTLACAPESKSMPIVVSLSGSTGTRSKRNFHRPESNCGIALNSTFRVLIVFLRWLRLRIRSPRRSRDSVPQTRMKCSNLSFQESDFSSCYFSQAFKGGHFTKPEMFSANALGAVNNCRAIDARLRLRLYCSLSEKQAPRSSQSTL